MASASKASHGLFVIANYVTVSETVSLPFKSYNQSTNQIVKWL